MRTWVRASSTTATGARSMPSWPAWPSASAASPSSISVAAWACPRIPARRGWTSPRSTAFCARSGGLSALSAVDGAGPLPGGRRRRAAGEGHPAEGQGRAALSRPGHRHEQPDPPDAVRSLARDRQPEPARRAGHRAVPGRRPDLREWRCARHRPSPARGAGGRRDPGRPGRCLRQGDVVARTTCATRPRKSSSSDAGSHAGRKSGDNARLAGELMCNRRCNRA